MLRELTETVDFERQTLTNGLSAAGVNLRTATFFSWLGVTQYLTSAADTLREVASSGCARK